MPLGIYEIASWASSEPAGSTRVGSEDGNINMLDLAQTGFDAQHFADLRDRPLADIIDEGRLIVAPWLAMRILTEARFAGQDARLRADEVNKHVAVIEIMMRRGIFRDGGQISFVRKADRLWLINGYHRLTALSRVGKSFAFRVAIDEIENEAEISAHFHHFDHFGKSRSDAQILAALDIAKKFDLPKGVTNTCWAAMTFINNGLMPAHGDNQNDEVTAFNRVVDLRADVAAPWWEFAAKVNEAMKPAPLNVRQKIFQGGRFAIGLVSMRYQPIKAWEFWRGLALDDGLRTGDPRKTLLKDLVKRKISAGAGVESVLQVTVPWNSFFRNTPLVQLKLPLDRVPRVLGTPFANGQPS